MVTIARRNLNVPVGEWVDAPDGKGRQFVKERTVRFIKGETIPNGLLKYITNPEALAEEGEDLDAPRPDSPEAVQATRAAAYDKLATVDQVRAWIDGHALTERADAAVFAIGMENQGKQRVGILNHAGKVLETLGQAVPESGDGGPTVTQGGGKVVVDGNAEGEPGLKD